MERWNLTMENINDYAKKQSDMCVENDSIPKALYADYGKRFRRRSTESML